MDNSKTNSINLAQLTAKVQEAVAQVRRENPRLFEAEPEISFMPHPGIIGFIIREPAVKDRSFGDISNAANVVARQLGPISGGEPASIVVRDGKIVLGFFPRREL